MIKSVEFPDKSFSSKEELFAELKSNKDNLIDLKKSTKDSDSVSVKFLDSKDSSCKAIANEENFIYAVINTTKVLDSHSDVHIDGIWNKSITEQQGKVYYVSDHDLSLKSVIAFPKDVQMYVQEVSFKELGYNIDGNTQALIFKVSKDKIRLQEAKDIINEKIQIEHSIRMQYVKLALGINSDSEDYKEEKAIWDNYISVIANKEQAIELGYFWAVTEAKIYKEGSMVLAGSNSVTPLLQKNIEPDLSTQTNEPLKSTQGNNAIDWQQVVNKF
jgi:hypothetical protein